MIYYALGNPEKALKKEDIREALVVTLDYFSDRKNIFIIPPDITRSHSGAGMITEMLWNILDDRVKGILPASGTHMPMVRQEISRMFGMTPSGLFYSHQWRDDVVELGRIPSSFISQITEGKLGFDFPVQVNRMIASGSHDLIISVGQVVPHEITGMANYNKNIFIGCGGSEAINKCHFIGAVNGVENTIGTIDNPARKVLNKASEMAGDRLPLLYILTVIAPDDSGTLRMKGIFMGDDEECFRLSVSLSKKVNITALPSRLKKIVIYLDPGEFRSTWMGNMSIQRTRMAIADGGEIILLAPGVRTFGEDPEIDSLIRKYGYKTKREILSFVTGNSELQNNLSAAAHLINGSTENRFIVTYATKNLSREEIESVGYEYGELNELMVRYDPGILNPGFNRLANGEEVYFIPNPAIGLWKTQK